MQRLGALNKSMNQVTGSVLALILGVGACAHDDTPAVHTDIESSRQIGDLDPADEQALCEDLNDFSLEVLDEDFRTRLACFSVTIAGGADDPDSCQETFDSCLAAPPTDLGGVTFDLGTTCDFEGIPESCDATVGELIDCTVATILLLEEVVDGFNCSAQENSTAWEQTPTECETLYAACPELR